MYAAGGLIVGFLYESVGWRWLNLGSAGFAALAFVYNSLLPTSPLPKAGSKQKSEGLSKALCSAEFASHAWTAFNMGWSVPSLQPSVSRQAGGPRSIQAEPYV